MYKITGTKPKETSNLMSHSFAKAFDGMEGGDYDKLLDHLKKNKGAEVDVILYKGLILDGRHRYKASKVAKTKVNYKEFKGNDDEARDFVASVNINRRHLSQDQKAIALAKLYPERQVDKNKTLGPEGPVAKTIAERAEEAGVGERTLKRAKQVVNNASKATVDAVAEGKISAKEAIEVTKADNEKEALKEMIKEKEEPKKPKEKEPKEEVKTYDCVYVDTEFAAKDISIWMNHRPKRGKMGFIRFHPSDLTHAIDFASSWNIDICSIVMIERSKNKSDGVTKGDYDCCLIVSSDEINIPIKDRMSNVVKDAEFIKKVQAQEGKSNLLLGTADIKGWIKL